MGSSCNLDAVKNELEELFSIYTKEIRKPLAGKIPLDTSSIMDIVDFLSKSKNSKEAYDKKVTSGSPSFGRKSINNFSLKFIPEGTGVPKKPLGSIVSKIEPTLFNSLNYVLAKDVKDVNNIPDNTFVIEGELEKQVVMFSDLLQDLTLGEKTTTNKQLPTKELAHRYDWLREKLPALDIFYDAGSPSKLNLGAVVALVAGSFEVLGKNSSQLMGPKNDERIADIVGIEENEVNNYLRDKFKFGGTGISLFAEDAGNLIADKLGIKGTNLALKHEKKLIVSLGLLATEFLEKKLQLIEPMTLKMEELVGKVLGKEKSKDKELVAKIANFLESKRAVSFLHHQKEDFPEELKTLLNTNDNKKLTEFKNTLLSTIEKDYKGIVFPDLYTKADAPVNMNEAIKVVKGTSEKNYRPVYKYVIMKNIKGINKFIDNSINSLDIFADLDNAVKKPLFDKPEGRSIRKRRDRLSKLSSIQQEYIETAESIPYTLNEGLDVLLDTFTVDGKLDEKALMIAAGYEASIDNDVTREVREANEARNNQIEKTVTDLLDFIKEYDEKDKPSFYYPQFLPSNNRTMEDVVVLNKQNDKEFARWLVSQKLDSPDTVTRGELDSLLSKSSITVEEFKKLNPSLQATVLGSVQAFTKGMLGKHKVADIEKGILPDIFNSFKELMKADIDTLTVLLKDPNVGHVGQKAAAIAFIKNTKDSNNTSFPTYVSFEVDGITNALFYKLLQTPVEGHEEMLRKVGVVTAEDYPNVEHVGDIRNVEDNYVDNYQNFGTVFGKNVIKTVNEGDSDSAFSVLYKEKLFVISDISEVVGSAVRDFVKPGSMIINYGAGVGKIVEQAVDVYLHDAKGLLNKLVKKKEGKYVVSDDVVATLIGVKGEKNASNIVAEFRNLLLKESGFTVKASPYYQNIRDVARIGIGRQIIDPETKQAIMVGPMAEALDEVYGGYIELGKISSTLYNAMYEAFRNKLEEAAPDGDLLNLSSKQIARVMRELRYIMPSLVRPDSISPENYTTILGKGFISLDAKADEHVSPSNIPKGEFASKNPTAATLGSLTAGLLVDLPEKPGAKGLPFDTHTRDNLDMITSDLLVFKETGVLPTQIFDAKILTGGSIQGSGVYNKTAFENNAFSSSFEDLLLRIVNLQNVIQENVSEDTWAFFFDTFIGLSSAYSSIVEQRKNIFSKNMKVMQMGGTVHSRYDYSSNDFLKETESKFIESREKLNKYLEENPKYLDSEGYDVLFKDLLNASPDSAKVPSIAYILAWDGLLDEELNVIITDMKRFNTGVRTVKGIEIDTSDVATQEASNSYSPKFGRDLEVTRGELQQSIKNTLDILEDKKALLNNIKSIFKDVLNEAKKDTNRQTYVKNLETLLKGCI